MESKEYKIIYSNRVLKELEYIKHYILELSKSEVIALKRVKDIISGIEILKVFPEVGFNADEKFGTVVDERGMTRGLTLKKDYIVLYNIDEEHKLVKVSYLLPTKSDYMKLF